MWIKWFPWRLFISKLARSSGFMDPIAVLSQFRRFSQPSEVLAPDELLRAGVIFHARGLINSQAIQHNLDWVWPYWVERQFDPEDPAFIPRAFSLTHINLSHRNWTAVGLPGYEQMPLIDPRGLVTPELDGWSLDAWIVEGENLLIPSREKDCHQNVVCNGRYSVVTSCSHQDLSLRSEAWVELSQEGPECRILLKGSSQKAALLVVSVRPYNPEGVSFIHDIELIRPKQGWKINHRDHVWFSLLPDQTSLSCYSMGDVLGTINCPNGIRKMRCEVGMGTAAALFRLLPGEERSVDVRIPLTGKGNAKPSCPPRVETWDSALSEAATFTSQDSRYASLYANAVQAMVLLSPGDIYAGPFTYKRFWFRDAALVANALLCAGLISRAEAVINHFPSRQTRSGYFLSQNGEWDSNGQVLWIVNRWSELSGKQPSPQLLRAVQKGADWIIAKRSKGGSDPHSGLFPPGFSAEHLGPNDYYYWDDFWGVAGLLAAAVLRERSARGEGKRYVKAAEDFMDAIERSVMAVSRRLGHNALPSAPYRRMDSSAIGSLAVSYPLQLWPTSDRRILETAGYLFDNCRVRGAFFHDMTHSGINPYLTLHIAQAFLRAGDRRFADLTRAIADLASETGQWPEAIHPATAGGCMGDGQHTWAAGEWVLMMRNSFVREESQDLILCSGLTKDFFPNMNPASYGPAPTPFGTITVTVEPGATTTKVSWTASWRDKEPTIRVAFPGHPVTTVKPGSNSVEVPLEYLQ